MGFSEATRIQLEPTLVYQPSCADEQVLQIESGEAPTCPAAHVTYGVPRLADAAIQRGEDTACAVGVRQQLQLYLYTAHMTQVL